MTTGTQTPALEDIDSPEHRKKYNEVLVGTNPGMPQANYDELCRYLGRRYGVVKWVEKEKPGGIPFKNSKPFILMDCSPEQEARLQEDYERNGQKTPFKYVRCIHRMKDDVRLIY